MSQRGVLVLSLLAFSSCGSGGVKTSTPPHTCPKGKAVVSLTYDDGLKSQVANAIPALDSRDFKGTFFLNDVSENPGPWRAAARRGHELGAHTTNHPCTAEFDWVKPGMASEDYDLGRMARELDHQVAELEFLGQKGPYTFAYPCGTTWVGKAHISYIDLVEERFIAARGVDGRAVTQGDAPSNIPAYFIEGPADALIGAVAGALDNKAWVVLGFHGVGGDYLSVTKQDHETLLDWLASHRDEVDVLPFGQAARCVLAPALKMSSEASPQTDEALDSVIGQIGLVGLVGRAKLFLQK
jgi:hypothetical protein